MSLEKFTSTKYENNDPLFSAALRLNAFVKNARGGIFEIKLFYKCGSRVRPHL